MSESFDKERIVLELILGHYLDSHDFNGIPLHILSDVLKAKKAELMDRLRILVTNGQIELLYSDVHRNPHIKTHPPEPVETQLRKLNTADWDQACAYPTGQTLRNRVDPNTFQGRPYTLRLALGTPQLEFASFDLPVLEKYRNDPRYSFRCGDFVGGFGLKDQFASDPAFSTMQATGLQSFGFAYDQNLRRAVAVYLVYLSGLSIADQQHWSSHEIQGEFDLHPDYYRTSIQGQFPERISVFDAILEELRTINRMSVAVGRVPLFRVVPDEEHKPREFSFLVRPTLREFNQFVELLDKLLSQNIDKSFFGDDIRTEERQLVEGGGFKIVEKGTIRLLSEWLDVVFSPQTQEDSEQVKLIAETLQQTRKMRQKPAHRVLEDEFDQEYFKQQRELAKSSYVAVRNLRLVLATNPDAAGVEVHPYLRDARIWTY